MKIFIFQGHPVNRLLAKRRSMLQAGFLGDLVVGLPATCARVDGEIHFQSM